MFSRLTIALACAGAALIAPLAQAQGAAPTQYKIGVVDMQQVVEQSELRKGKYADLAKLRDSLQGDLDSLSAKIESAQKDFEKNASTMSDADRLQKKTALENDMTTWQAEMKKRQNQVDNEEKKILKDVFEKIEAVVKQVAEQQNYHLVLKAGTVTQGAVVYSSPTIDITSQVLAQLNQGVPAAPKEAAPAAKEEKPAKGKRK